MSARRSNRRGRSGVRPPTEPSERSVAKTAPHDIDTIASVESIQQIDAFFGPLPRPDDYAAYEQTMTGAADRIMTMAENQNTHRIRQEERSLDANIRISTRSQWFSLVIVMVGMGLAAYLAAIDQLVMGGVFAVSALAELALHIYTHLRRLNNPPAAARTPPVDIPPVVRQTDPSER